MALEIWIVTAMHIKESWFLAYHPLYDRDSVPTMR